MSVTLILIIEEYSISSTLLLLTLSDPTEVFKVFSMFLYSTFHLNFAFMQQTMASCFIESGLSKF